MGRYEDDLYLGRYVDGSVCVSRYVNGSVYVGR